MIRSSRNRLHGLLAATTAMLIVLAGCGSSSTDAADDTGSTDQSGASSSSGTLTFGDVPSEKTTIEVWSFLPGNYDKGEEAYDKVVSAFEDKYPQVTVDLVNMPYPKYFDQVRNATVAQSGPDVITMYGGSQAYSYRNGLYPLQDAMSPEVEKNLKFIPDNYSPDGNLYILPTGTYGYALLTNDTLFKKAGLSADEALSSWSNMLNACTTLYEAGIRPMAAGWQDGFLFETYMYMISSQMMDSDTLDKWVGGEIPISDPLFAQATNYILAMNDAHCFGDAADTVGLNMYNDAFNQYFSGKAAMLANGSLSRTTKAYDKLDGAHIYPLPQVPESQFEPPFIDAGAEAGWSVTKWTDSPQASLAFVNFMATDAQEILWEMVGVPPNLKNASIEATTPALKDALPILLNPENHTGFAAFPLPVLAVFERNAASLIKGAMSPETFLAQAQTAYEKTK